MAQKRNSTQQGKHESGRSRQNTKANRRRATANMRAKTRTKNQKSTRIKAASPSELQAKSAGVNRSEGIRLFKVAGRPTKEQFIRVYGAAGPKMTWEQRSKAGVPAEKFQAALASAMRQAK